MLLKLLAVNVYTGFMSGMGKSNSRATFSGEAGWTGHKVPQKSLYGALGFFKCSLKFSP